MLAFASVGACSESDSSSDEEPAEVPVEEEQNTSSGGERPERTLTPPDPTGGSTAAGHTGGAPSFGGGAGSFPMDTGGTTTGTGGGIVISSTGGGSSGGNSSGGGGSYVESCAGEADGIYCEENLEALASYDPGDALHLCFGGETIAVTLCDWSCNPGQDACFDQGAGQGQGQWNAAQKPSPSGPEAFCFQCGYTMCEETRTACFTDDACGDIYTCWTYCDSKACKNACVRDNSAGEALWDPFAACATSTCKDYCNSSDGLPYFGGGGPVPI